MTTLAFAGGGTYGRRSIARRAKQPAVKTVRVSKKLSAVPLSDAMAHQASVNAAAAAAARKSKLSFTILAASIVGLHLAGYYWLSQPGNREALARLSPLGPLSIEIAPPPPPSPVVEKPKPPEPKIVKVVPQKVNTPRPDPALPVVDSPPTDSAPSANSVQVAAPSLPAPPAPPSAPEPITEARGFAGYKNNPPPSYPPAAQRRGIEGTVTLRVHVLANGLPDDVKVSKTSGQPILDEAATKTVLGWTFEPAKRGKTPIDGYVTVPIIFKL